MSSELVARNPQRLIELRNFQLRPIGLVVTGQPTFEEWTEVGDMLATLVNGVQWMVGDWLNTGEACFGDLAAQVIDHEHWSEESVRVFKWTAAKIPLENRRAELSYSHHQLLAALPPPEQKVWLDKAVAGDGDGEPWTSARLKQEVRSAQGAAELEYLVSIAFDSPAARDVLAAEYERVGRPVRRHERQKAKAN